MLAYYYYYCNVAVEVPASLSGRHRHWHLRSTPTAAVASAAAAGLLCWPQPEAASGIPVWLVSRSEWALALLLVVVNY